MCPEFSNIALSANVYNESAQKSHCAQAGTVHEHSKDFLAEGCWRNPEANFKAHAWQNSLAQRNCPNIWTLVTFVFEVSIKI